MKPDKANLILEQELVRQADQGAWATRQWIKFVMNQENEKRPRELLSHIVLSDRVWFERIDGKQKIKDTFAFLSENDLMKILDENLKTYKSLIASKLGIDISFTRASGEKYHARVIDILYQLLTHAYHHRGQLAAHYARKKVTFPNTDHINYLLVSGQ